MLWLAAHFPRLPLEVFGNTTGNPAVVLQDNRVFLRNAAAAEHGIEAGATLATAHSIYPGLRHVNRSTDAELKRLQALAEQLYELSGYVSLQPPDCVLLEIGGSLKLFHSHQILARRAVALCRALGHDCTVRVAHTPWAAIALARACCRQLSDVPLAEAGLALAGIKADVVERFANMGIYTLGPLLDLPSRALGRRFGRDLLQYLGQLTGDVPDPRQAITPAQTFTRAVHLLSPARDKIELYEHELSPVRRLAGEFRHWLVARQLGCERLIWRFVSHNGKAACVPVRFAQARQSTADIMHISTLKLDQAELPEEVLSVALEATRLEPWKGHSTSLFQLPGHGTPEPAEGLSGLIDEFNARLGEGACRGIQPVAQHAPESAWRAAPALPAGRNRACLQQLSRRPLWLFEPPRRIHAEELELLQGPERIQSQWWQGNTVRRDYYIARHRSGAECWAFIDPQEHWYLHGYFG